MTLKKKGIPILGEETILEKYIQLMELHLN